MTQSLQPKEVGGIAKCGNRPPESENLERKEKEMHSRVGSREFWLERIREVLVAGLILFASLSSVLAAELEVDMQEIEFLPSHIAAKKGDIITFKNLDRFEHTLNIVNAADRSIEVLPETEVKGGASFTTTMDTDGVFILYCTTHGGMKGVISTTGNFDLPKVALGTTMPREVKLGKKLFWGNAQCHFCHKIGKEGAGTRGPNLEDVGFRAGKRAKKLGLESATAYLIQSVVHPDAYIVSGRINDMPKTYLPPIGLTPEELTNVIVYLQSQGGKPDPFEVSLPSEVRNPVMAWEAYLKGDSEEGKKLFWDTSSPVACGKCHTVNDQGGKVGPNLTGIGAVYPLKFFIKAILDPSADIATGFETVMVATTDRQFITGLVVSETKDQLVVMDPRDKDGKVTTIPKDKITRRAVQPLSMMPGNFAEIMTVKQLHNILAYLTTLR